MRPTRKLDTRYDRREKYSNFMILEPKAFIPLLALSGVMLYYMGKGISKLSGRMGKAATNTTRNIILGVGAIVVYYKVKNYQVDRIESNEETSTIMRPDIDVPLNALDASDPKTPKVNVLNV